jgi:hypothetical protein
MDGITPTLALAALLLGLSGNARDAVNNQTAELRIEGGSGCPTLVVSGNPAQLPSREMWAEEFWSTASRGSTPRDLIDPNGMERALLEAKRSDLVADPAPAAAHQSSDPVMRRIVTTGKNLPIAAPGTDPCPPTL